SCSHSSTSAAPREAASKPSAPVPANASRQRQPGSAPPPAPARLASQLNSVSRTRSGVGRRPGRSATARRVRFHWPPMMRSSCARAARGADLWGWPFIRASLAALAPAFRAVARFRLDRPLHLEQARADLVEEPLRRQHVGRPADADAVELAPRAAQAEPQRVDVRMPLAEGHAEAPLPVLG